MLGIISQPFTKCNPKQSRSSDVSEHPTNSSDLASRLLNSLIRKNIESFYRQYSKQEIEVFKYLMYYWNKFGNIQIPILNLSNRFKLGLRRIHYLLKKLQNTGILETIKKGYTGRATSRAITERGLILWKAISKGFGVVKQGIHRTCADSHADSSGVHTNYISTKVDSFQGRVALSNQNEELEKEKTNIDMPSFFKNLKEVCLGR